MRFFATRTEAQIEAANEEVWQKHLLKRIRIALRERQGIIRNKAALDLETAHQRLGYRSSEIVDFKDVYLPAFIAIKGLQKNSDHDLVPEIHALQFDLTNHLAYAKQPMREFSDADQAQIDIKNYLKHHNSQNSIKILAHDFEPMFETVDKIHDYLLSDINEAKTTLEIIGRTRFWLDQLVPQPESQNQPDSDNNQLPYARQSHLSQHILTNEAPVRQALIELGLENCQQAQEVLQAVDLDALPQKYLLNQIQIMENALSRLDERVQKEPQRALKEETPDLIPTAEESHFHFNVTTGR